MVWESNNLVEMNCPECKNPNKENSNQCEWCGAIILINNQDYSNSSNTILRYVFDGYNTLGNPNLSVFINGVLLKKGTLREGIIFEIAHTQVLPLIQIDVSKTNKVTLLIPKLDINKNYLITLEFSLWWSKFKSTPKFIQEF